MSIAQTLAEFQATVTQCNSLIASAHKQDANENFIFSQMDREQITVASFLNLFVGWEQFIESSIADFMTGDKAVGGGVPTKYVSPEHKDHAIAMIVGVMKYFDFANHEYVRKLSNIYFKDGYPFDSPIAGIVSDLSDLKTMRNASAHASATTVKALEALAIRLFAQPQPGITVYRMLTTVDPTSTTGDTIFATYRDKLVAAAHIIAHG